MRLNHVYLQALPHMVTRRLLPNGAGVRWDDGGVTTIWAYRDLVVRPASGASATMLGAEGPAQPLTGGEIRLDAGHVCMVRGGATLARR